MEHPPATEHPRSTHRSNSRPSAGSLPADHAVGHGYITDKEHYLASGSSASRARPAASTGWSTEEQYCIDILTQISALT